jgi:hypothetical protein
MNRIVRQNYPASRLPEELREGLSPGDKVTVTVELADASSRPPMTLEEILAARRPPYRTAEEIDADIRAGREDRNG